MKDLTAAGYNAPAREAKVITEEMEEEIWRQHILGDDNPTKLQMTVYFNLGEHFALRARQAHRQLRAGVTAQIQVLGMEKDEP